MNNLPVRHPYLLDDKNAFDLPLGDTELPDYYSQYNLVYADVSAFYKEILQEGVEEYWIAKLTFSSTWGYYSKEQDTRLSFRKVICGELLFDGVESVQQVETLQNPRCSISIYKNDHEALGTKRIEFKVNGENYYIIARVILPQPSESFILNDKNELIDFDEFVSKLK